MVLVALLAEFRSLKVLKVTSLNSTVSEAFPTFLKIVSIPHPFQKQREASWLTGVNTVVCVFGYHVYRIARRLWVRL